MDILGYVFGDHDHITERNKFFIPASNLFNLNWNWTSRTLEALNHGRNRVFVSALEVDPRIILQVALNKRPELFHCKFRKILVGVNNGPWIKRIWLLKQWHSNNFGGSLKLPRTILSIHNYSGDGRITSIHDRAVVVENVVLVKVLYGEVILDNKTLLSPTSKSNDKYLWSTQAPSATVVIQTLPNVFIIMPYKCKIWLVTWSLTSYH